MNYSLKGIFWAACMITSIKSSAAFLFSQALILKRLPSSTGSSVIQLLQRVRVTATSAAALTSDIQAGIYKSVPKGVKELN